MRSVSFLFWAYLPSAFTSTLQNLCLQKLLPVLDLSSAPFPAETVQVAEELYPSFSDALNAFSASDLALAVCESAPENLFPDIALDGLAADSLIPFRSAFIPAFQNFLKSNPPDQPCFYRQLPRSLRPHYSQIFIDSVRFFDFIPSDATSQTAAAVLHSHGLSLLGTFDLSPVPAAASASGGWHDIPPRRVHSLVGASGRFIAETKHLPGQLSVVTELIDLHRGCAVTVDTALAQTWKFLPERRTVVYSKDHVELVIHTGDEECPIKVASPRFSLGVEHIEADPTDPAGFTVRFDLGGRAFVSSLGRDLEHAPDFSFTYREVDLPDLVFNGYGQLRVGTDRVHIGTLNEGKADEVGERRNELVREAVERVMMNIPPFSRAHAQGDFAVFTGRGTQSGRGFLARLGKSKKNKRTAGDETPDANAEERRVRRREEEMI